MEEDEKLFECKTTEGYVFKILSELLQNNIKNGCFCIESTGIKLRMTDSNKKILIDLHLKAENFSYFNLCSTYEKLNVGINHSHLYKMLKSIKKKDSLVLFINKKNPIDLGIKINTKEQTRVTTSFIKIQNIQYLDLDLPTGYKKPIIIPSNEYLKLMKDMDSIGSNIMISSQTYNIKFFCDAGNVYSKEVFFGEKENKNEEFVVQEFDTEQLGRMSKISGMNNLIQIFQGKDLPILFVTNVGNMGKISIYAKTKRQIEEDGLKSEKKE